MRLVVSVADGRNTEVPKMTLAVGSGGLFYVWYLPTYPLSRCDKLCLAPSPAYFSYYKNMIGAHCSSISL